MSKQMTTCCLAKEWTNENPSGFYMSEKLDGMRCLWDGKALRSRTGTLIAAPKELLKELPPLALDGELFLARNSFQRCMSIVRSQNADLNSWRRIRYMIFDAPQVEGPFPTRLLAAQEALRRCSWAVLHEQRLCAGHDDLMKALDNVLDQGGEGLMLRWPEAPYECGRSRNLLKVKRFQDNEAQVVAHQQGRGKHAGRLGALICQNKSGQQFKIGTGFTDRERQAPPAIGSTITFKYQELTDAGVPRFPVFMRIREDL